MNILVLSCGDPKHPVSGGAEQVMHEHMKGWIKNGHKVTLISSRIKTLPRQETIDGVNILRMGVQYLGVQLLTFLWFRFKRKEIFDLIVDQFHGIPFFTPLYTRVPKLAVLQEVAKEVWFKNTFPFPFNYMVGSIGYLIEPVIIKRLYNNVPFMVGSQSAKNDLVDLGIKNSQITIIPHGLVKPKTINYSKDKIKIITFLGVLTVDKGVEDAIKAFALIKNKGNEYKYWVIGKGDSFFVKYLKNLSDKLGLKGKITFWGFVDQEKKFELLSRSHLLLNPSIREGWGLVNIEANSVGTPVIAYTSQGLIDSVKNGISGVLCKENNPQTLAKNVVEILKDDDKYKSLCKTSIKWSENFSWDKSSHLSLELIESIIK